MQTGRDTLLLNDAEMLLRTGQQRYELFHDGAGALKAYSQAIEVLAQVQNPAYAPVRASAITERDALAATAPPSRQTALDTLSTLRGKVASLPLATAATAAPSSAKPGFWSRVGNAFSGVVRVSRENGRTSPLADRIEVRQLGRSSRYELLVHKDGVAANLRDVGVGVAQVLPVLTVAYSVPPGSTVLLEEPEIHLHPLAQAVLAELFAEVSQQRRVQFLVETHSEHLFRRMQTLLARRQTTTAQCQMLFVERQGANAVLVPLEVDEFGAVRNWPPRFFGDAMGEAREQARARAQRMREAAGGGA